MCLVYIKNLQLILTKMSGQKVLTTALFSDYADCFLVYFILSRSKIKDYFCNDNISRGGVLLDCCRNLAVVMTAFQFYAG